MVVSHHLRLPFDGVGNLLAGSKNSIAFVTAGWFFVLFIFGVSRIALFVLINMAFRIFHIHPKTGRHLFLPAIVIFPPRLQSGASRPSSLLLIQPSTTLSSKNYPALDLIMFFMPRTAPRS